MTMRAEIIERILTETSRKRALSDEESLMLESAIHEQTYYRRTRDGRRYPSIKTHAKTASNGSSHNGYALKIAQSIES